MNVLTKVWYLNIYVNKPELKHDLLCKGWRNAEKVHNLLSLPENCLDQYPLNIFLKEVIIVEMLVNQLCTHANKICMWPEYYVMGQRSNCYWLFWDKEEYTRYLSVKVNFSLILACIYRYCYHCIVRANAEG